MLFALHQNDFNVTILWIPALVGIAGNEREDDLAKDAAKNADETLYANEWHSSMAPLKKNRQPLAAKEVRGRFRPLLPLNHT